MLDGSDSRVEDRGKRERRKGQSKYKNKCKWGRHIDYRSTNPLCITAEALRGGGSRGGSGIWEDEVMKNERIHMVQESIRVCVGERVAKKKRREVYMKEGYFRLKFEWL